MKRREFLKGLVASPVAIGVGADLVAVLAEKLQEHPNDIEWSETYQDYGHYIMFTAKVDARRFSISYPACRVRTGDMTEDEIRACAREVLIANIELAKKGEPHAGHTAIGKGNG
jgi:hypothetical protein